MQPGAAKRGEEEEAPMKLVQGLPAPPAHCCYLSQSVGCKNSTGSVTLEPGSVFLTPWFPGGRDREEEWWNGIRVHVIGSQPN